MREGSGKRKHSGGSAVKKVGIVSCYFQHNYGSMLQAYATQKALDRLGVDNETIDISGFRGEIRKAKMLYFFKASVTSDILLSKFGMLANVLRKRMLKNDYAQKSAERDALFDAFWQKHFRLSPPCPSKKALGEYCQREYTDVLVGSDQLWLPANIAADYYTLNFVPDSINTVAYATSFGQNTLPKDSAKKAAVFLRRIRSIGVREESGQKLVKELTGREVPVVCDPTLLFTGEEWASVQNEEPLVAGKYILCYFLGNNPGQRDFAARLGRETGCNIVALPHLDEYVPSDEHYADEMLYRVDPADFMNLVRHAAYICTDSFHCTVFSMLYRKTFFVFRRYARKTACSTNSRLDSLLHLAGISGRILTGNEEVKACLSHSIDYEAVEENLQLLRAQSYEYLKRALGLS